MKEYICKNCGFVGKPKKQAQGNIIIEIILWFLLIIPGLVYSFWRILTKQPVCPKCKSLDIIPVDTPQGQTLFNKQKNK